MTPLHPILLTGAVLVGLPIILHLIMRQEPKRLPFPAFRFLRQKRFINQRKIRLRHILLLLMRMLLIALMGLALFQPRLLSERFHLQSEQPVAAVLILDTSPSMGYELGGRTRLEEIRQRALELLDGLPAESSIAVINTGGDIARTTWLPTMNDARNVIESITTPAAANQPVTDALDQAYRLLQVIDRDRLSPDDQPLPRFIAIFSDRTAASWENERVDDLESQRDKVPQPGINAVYVDLGVKNPVNMALLNVQTSTSFNSEYEAVVDIRVGVRATGKDAENVVVCRFDGEASPDRQPVSLREGQTRSITIRRTGLPPGLHQAEITLLSTDSLPFDNARFVTFIIPEPQPVLIIADNEDDPILWQGALESTNRFRCDIIQPADVRDFKPEDWNKYVAVCLLDVADPRGLRPARSPATRQAGLGERGQSLWAPLSEYVQRGGNLVVIPGGDEMRIAGYTSEEALALLPGKFIKLVDAEDLGKGVTWLWNSLNYRHPLLAPFRDWQQQKNIGFIAVPPVAYRYWIVEPDDKNGVIVSYNDENTNPALVEGVQGRGKVLMYTVTMDGRRDVNDRAWNTYLQTSFYLVISNLSMTYLVGDESEREVNFTTGQTLRLPLPLSEASKPETTYLLEGPGIVGNAALLTRPRPGVGAAEAMLTVDRARTGTAGNFVVRSQDRAWRDGYSLNIPVDESDLKRVEVDTIESLLGEKSVLEPEEDLELSQVLERRFNQPLDLFPWLMIAVLLFFAFENLLANRFYRKPAVAEDNAT